MHLSIIGKKKTIILALGVVLLFAISACTGNPEYDKRKYPGTEQNENAADKSANDSSANQEPESRESNVIPEQNPGFSSDGNTGENESKATSDKTSDKTEKTPEEILKEYYYVAIDQPSVDFELEDLEGNMVKLSDLKGKIVFLNFWATWCPPCREEMPHMQAFYEKYKDEDIVLLAVNPNQTENQGINDSAKAERKAREFVEKQGFTFPVLLDRDDSVWAVYQQRGIPANYVIDSEGTVKYLKPGAFTGVEEMEAFMEAVRAAGN